VIVFVRNVEVLAMLVKFNAYKRTALAACSLLFAAACHAQEPPADEAKPAAKTAKKKHTNRLAKESSPYLLLHAHNPVDWFPWGKEALDKAKKENKLIFLSIGYSSCYWCHVMERESFMDEEVAKFLNEHYVCIKVDREERPDIDEIYMTSLHVYNELTGGRGRGGWPLSMFLTPEGKPVGGFTYLPPRADKKRGFGAGFLDVIKSVDKVWADKSESVTKQAASITDAVQRQLRQRPLVTAALPEAKDVDKLQTVLRGDFDARWGGFGYSEENAKQPKFPEPSNLVFLLHRARHAADKAARDEAQKMLVKTVDAMAAGGIWDHVGGGFHRYSTDRYWRIPHFEKMLYDNGQLASVYAEAYALTGRSEYRAVVEGLLEFVLREMRSPQGAFYAALDAETDAEEGRYYVWETAELKGHMSAEEFALFAAAYGVSEGANFEGRHTLLLPRTLAETAAARQPKLSAEELEAKLAPLRKKLLAVRDKRPRPLTDTKVLTSWNGLMIRGLADAGRLLKNDRYLKSAAAAADFVLKELRTSDGRLLRTYSADKAKLNAYLDDYAFLANGLIALHQATADARWLEAAKQLTDKEIELFWDDRDGGFFFTSKDHEELIARSKGPTDGALPSGNSVSAENLLELSRQWKEPKYRERAEKTIAARAGVLKEYPQAFPRMFTVLARLREGEGKGK
jgi:uncharacterized protein YyaL (SSP411 family)